MKKHSRIILVTLCLIMLICCTVLPVAANSAQKDWNGRDESGVMTTDGECPLVVEAEVLTFDLGEFPSFHLPSKEDLEKYTGTVSAEYTFFNPSDMTVTTQMAFPMADTFQTYPRDYADYRITVDGEPVSTEMRHTLSYYNTDFSVETDLPRLLDDYIEDDFFTEDVEVKEYTITISGLNYQTHKNGQSKYALDIDPDQFAGTKLYFPDDPSYKKLDDGSYRIYNNVLRNGQTITFYTIGQPMRIYPEIKIYENWRCNDDEVIEGSGKIEYVGEDSLSNLIFRDYDESRGISRVDWYNANVEIMRGRSAEKNPLVTISSFDDWYEYRLTTWYCYEVTVGPGERIQNKIVSPMFPDVNAWYEPTVYDYTYLLSPASTWSDFGRLDIYINTPFYMNECNLKGFEKTEDGYHLALEGLPKDDDGEWEELSFRLSSSERPIPDSQTPSGIVNSIFYFVAFFWPFLLGGLVLLIILIIILKLIFRR